MSNKISQSEINEILTNKNKVSSYACMYYINSSICSIRSTDFLNESYKEKYKYCNKCPLQPVVKEIKEEKEMFSESNIKPKKWSYEFKTVPKMIDWNLIANDLSYLEPMCIVEYGKKTFAVIHKSIGRKVVLSDNSFCEIELNTDGHTIIRIDKNDIDWYKQEVRMIKESEWNKSTKTIKVTKINV